MAYLPLICLEFSDTFRVSLGECSNFTANQEYLNAAKLTHHQDFIDDMILPIEESSNILLRIERNSVLSTSCDLGGSRDSPSESDSTR